MTDVARWLARLVWWRMLRFLRWPPVRRWRRSVLGKVNPKAARRMIRQDRFARRYGRNILTFSFTLLLASCAITGCFFLVLQLAQSGLFGPPR